MHVDVHRDGLRACLRGVEHVVTWGVVTSLNSLVIYRQSAGTTRAHTVVLNSGTRLVLTEWIDGVEAIVDRLRRETAARMLPAIRATLAGPAGRVAFGPVTLTISGVEAAKRFVPYPELDLVVLAGGHLELVARADRGKPWSRVPAARVANLHVLLPLLAEHAPAARFSG